MRAIGLVGAVVADEMHEVLRRRRPDRDQAAEIHQQAAIAIEHQYALVGPPQRQPQAMRGGEPHGADREIVERARIELAPFRGRAVGSNHDLVRHMAGENPEAVVAFHHLRHPGGSGLRPIRSATGSDLA